MPNTRAVQLAKCPDLDVPLVLNPHGWGLVRASNTQAILVLRFEADSDEELEKIQATIDAKVKEFVGGYA